MATLTTNDIVFYYTGTGDGGANPALGSTINATTITDATANNVFDDVSGDESETGIVEYRCIAVKDTHASADMLNTKVYISGYVRSASTNDVISFVLQAPAGGTACTTIASETASPSTAAMTVLVGPGNTVAWTDEGAPSSTLTYGTITHGEWMGIWLRRDVPVTASAFSNRAFTLTVLCETTGSPMYSVVKELVINTKDIFYGRISDAI